MPEQFSDRLREFIFAEDLNVTPYEEIIAALEAKANEMREFLVNFGKTDGQGSR